MALRMTSRLAGGLSASRSSLHSAIVGSSSTATAAPALSAASQHLLGARRWKGADAGDVIGIDLGTTNSCVALMVSTNYNGNWR